MLADGDGLCHYVSSLQQIFSKMLAHLLDQHVQVLWDRGG
jgi:hypothetical protein